MKAHTKEYKEQIKKLGKEIDSIISYEIDGEKVELRKADLNSVTPHFESDILKSAMKQLDIDSNVEIPLNTILNYQFGVKVDGEYEYINYGNYVVYKVEKQEDTRSWLITCYDKMLVSMKPYEKMDIQYPISVRDYMIAICDKLGLVFKNRNEEFANYDKMINNELYLDSDGNDLGYTFRDVFDELAQVTASTICINEETDELEIRYVEDIIEETNIVSGSPLQLTNSIGKPLLGLNIDGNSEQETRSGKNLLPNNAVTKTVNGITFIINNDKSITLNGTATAKAPIVLLEQDLPLLSGDYVLSVSDTNITGVTIGIQIDSSYYAHGTKRQITLTSNSTFKKWYIDVESGTTLNNVTIYPMLEKGTIKTKYEQYGASPSPDYSSEVEVVGSTNIMEILNIGTNWELTQNGIKALQGNNGANICNIPLKANKTYVVNLLLKSKPILDTSIIAYIDGVENNNFSFAKIYNRSLNVLTSITYTPTSDCNLMYKMWGNNDNETFEFQFWCNEEKPKLYVPYGNIGLKNNKKSIYNASISETTNEDGTLSFSADTSKFYINGKGDNTKHTFGKQLLMEGTYTICCEKISGSFVKNLLFYVYESGTWNRPSSNESSLSDSDRLKAYTTFTLTKPTNIELGIFSMTTNEYDNVEVKYQIIEGDKPDYDFVPYQEKITYLDLKGNFIGKINDIKDELSIVGNKAKLKKNIKRYYFTGDEDIISNAYGTNSFQMPFFDAYFTENKITILSSHFVGIPFIDRTQEIANSIYKGDKWTLVIRNTTFTTLEEFKTFLKEKYDDGNPVYIDYILAEPYEVDLGTIELDTFEGVNNIFLLSSLDTNMEAEYITKYETLDEEFLKDVNVNFGKKFGPVNSVVLSRSAESDNIYIKNEESITQNGLCEIKITNNQIMNFNDRDQYLPEILNKLNDLEYYQNDYLSTGITYLNMCDKYYINVFDKKYPCVMLNNEALVTQGLQENIFTKLPKTTETDYKKADKTDRRINQTNLIVNKQLGTIEGLVSSVEEIKVDASDNYNEIINKFNDYTPSSKTLEIENSVKTLQTDTYTKTEINTKLTDGSVTKVMTTSGTFDENGMTYEKTNAPTKTTINEVGVNVKASNSYNDNSLLFAGYVDENNEQYSDYRGQTIVATDNIIVTHYLVEGSHTRIEDFVDEEGNECTAEFFLD